MAENHDIVIIGGGIIGLATALALSETPGRSVLVLEAEKRHAAHQSGHNSGVIHAGLYYTPGSLKARLCRDGREALYRFCADHDIKHERCGKILIAVTNDELNRLDDLRSRGEQNGLDGIETLTAEQISEREPHATGLGGLFIPHTGIVDFAEVCRAFADLIEQGDGQVRLDHRFLSAHQDNTRITVETSRGTLRCKLLINCAGLQSDRVAIKCGYRPGVRIIPFRGEYNVLIPTARHLVRHLIYPVPDPRFPFLGVHFTRTIEGEIEVGPNAVLSFARHGYHPRAFNVRDTIDMLRFRGFWRMARRHWRVGMIERRRSRHPRLALPPMQRLIPELQADDLARGRVGVRAMAVDRRGNLVDDFRIVRDNRIVHVLNAPSPAATASIAIGRYLADLVEP